MSVPVIDDPSELHPLWAEYFNAQDIDGMLALAEPDSVFVPSPGVPPLVGEGAREALAGFLSLKLPVSMSVRHSIVAGDLALLVAEWSISGDGPDGNPVELSGSTADVARRGENGWKFVIDNPSGTA